MEYIGRVENGLVVLETNKPPANGTRVRVVELEPAPATSGLNRDDFWRSRTFTELAAEQKVQPVESFEELLGGWPEDELDDEFEEEWMRWRHGERE